MTQDNQLLYVACTDCGAILKELTDKEIIATFNYFCSVKEEESAVNSHKYFEEAMILYARLILETASRKAQEK